MGYVQMTLNDWLEMKESLKKDLIGVQESFVRIGFTLRRIEEQKLYEQDGYKSIAEFAKAEYDLSPSTVSRFISINEKYSVGGYSDQLRPEFARLGSSKLSEMLSLPDSDLQMIQPETPRESIRELKQFNKSTPPAGEADDIRELVRKFLSDDMETVKKLRTAGIEERLEQGSVKDLIEIVNPGGNRSYRKGLYFLMMYENRITIKKFGSTPQDMTWEEFFRIAGEELPEEPEEAEEPEEMAEPEEAANEEQAPETTDDPESIETNEEPEQAEEPAEQETQEEHMERATEQEQAAEPEQAAETEQNLEQDQEPEPEPSWEQAPESDDTQPETTENQPEEEAEEAPETEEIAPAQKSEETRQNQGFEAIEEPETEVIEKPFGTRKEYLDALELEAAAEYLVMEYIRNHLTTMDLKSRTAMEYWLREHVDENGKTYYGGTE